MICKIVQSLIFFLTGAVYIVASMHEPLLNLMCTLNTHPVFYCILVVNYYFLFLDLPNKMIWNIHRSIVFLLFVAAYVKGNMGEVLPNLIWTLMLNMHVVVFCILAIAAYYYFFLFVYLLNDEHFVLSLWLCFGVEGGMGTNMTPCYLFRNRAAAAGLEH